jgi:ferric-dicitrate binding protein FerR (iron transport regulator)
MSTAADALDELLNRLVDDLLDDEGGARLQALLAADAGARRRYRRFIALHAGLRWDYVAAAREPLATPAAPAARRWNPWLGALAASLLLAATMALWPALSDRAPTLEVTVAAVAGGSLTWSGGGAARALDGGETLGAGRFALEGDGATATLRFADGTSLALTGDTEVTVDRESGLRLQLARGTLSADVAPQSPDHPLVMRTATARLVVLGTAFTVTASAGTTALDVEHGRVRLERLADGQTVEVGAQQAAVASLDTTRALASAARARPPTAWSLDLSRPPPSFWRGDWTPPNGASPAFLRAVPYVAGRTAQGAPIIHHGVNVRSLAGENIPFVRFVAGGHLALRFRVARPDGRAQIDVMVCTHTGSGAFGGTFTAPIRADQHPADAEGWRSVRLRVEDFRPVRPSQPSLIDREAVFILPRSTSAQTGLEVAAITVEAP